MISGMLPLAVEATTEAIRPWPDAIDRTVIATYLLLAFGIPALGYWFMALDIRSYLRSLRRALVVITRLPTLWTPSWARDERPPCL